LSDTDKHLDYLKRLTADLAAHAGGALAELEGKLSEPIAVVGNGMPVSGRSGFPGDLVGDGG